MSMSMKLQCMQETNIHEKKQQNIMCFKIHGTRETITLEKETHRTSCAGTWTRSFSVYEKHLLSRRKLTKHYVLEHPSNPVYAYAYVKQAGTCISCEDLSVCKSDKKSNKNKQDLGLKCSAWKVFGSKDFGLVGLYQKTKLDLFGSKKNLGLKIFWVKKNFCKKNFVPKKWLS